MDEYTEAKLNKTIDDLKLEVEFLKTDNAKVNIILNRIIQMLAGAKGVDIEVSANNRLSYETLSDEAIILSNEISTGFIKDVNER